MSRVEIFTDGACSGNPGPGGWGAILRFGEATRELNGGAEETTNNRMELTAAIEALNALTRPCDVVLTTDSVYVKDGITAWIDGWKRRGWKNSKKEPVKNEVAQQHHRDTSKIQSVSPVEAHVASSGQLCARIPSHGKGTKHLLHTPAIVPPPQCHLHHPH